MIKSLSLLIKNKKVRSNYSALGASTGHTSAQDPHSMQLSASITYWSSPADIHSTGHSYSHAPQLIQASLIM